MNRVRYCAAVLAAVAFLAVDPRVFAEEPGQAKPGDDLKELPRGKLEDGVFLQTGDIKILAKDVDKILLLMLTDEKKRYPKNVPSADRVMRGRVEIAQNLLLKALILKYAQDNKLSTKPEDVDKFIEIKKGELKRENSTFEQMLADEGWTEAEYRNFWGAKLAIERHASDVLTDGEIDGTFNLNKDQYPLRSAAHILFQYKGADTAPKTLTRTKDEAKALAEETIKKLKEGKSFAELANASDEEKNRSNGGQLDFFPLKGEKAMVESFGQAVYAMKNVGDISPVVETPFGFHVIKLTGIHDAEFKADIRRYLAAQKFNELLQPMLVKAMEVAKFNEALTSVNPGK